MLENMLFNNGLPNKRTRDKVFKITNEQMDVAWLTMEKHLHAYMRHLKGEKPTVYNSPNVVTLDLDDEV